MGARKNGARDTRGERGAPAREARENRFFFAFLRDRKISIGLEAPKGINGRVERENC